MVMRNDSLIVTAETTFLIYTNAGHSLKEAFRFASENYFPPKGKLPEELLFQLLSIIPGLNWFSIKIKKIFWIMPARSLQTDFLREF